MLLHGNLMQYSQQGWEALNGLYKQAIDKLSNKGGFRGKSEDNKKLHYSIVDFLVQFSVRRTIYYLDTVQLPDNSMPLYKGSWASNFVEQIIHNSKEHLKGSGVYKLLLLEESELDKTYDFTVNNDFEDQIEECCFDWNNDDIHMPNTPSICTSSRNIIEELEDN